MTAIKGKVSVWLSQYSAVTPEEIQSGDVNPHRFTFWPHGADMSKDGYTYVGEAEIAVEAIDAKSIIDNKVLALREEAKSIRAEAHKKCVEIEDKINQLLALPFEPASKVEA